MRLVKIALPLCAFMMLSVMFLLAKSPAANLALPYSNTDEPVILDGMRNARIVGVSDSGAEIDARASEITPDGAAASVKDFALDVTSPDGAQTRLSSDRAEISQNAERATFQDNARITTSGGFEITSDQFNADFNQDRISTPGSVSASGPFGQITAGAMDMTLSSSDQHSRIVFRHGVELVYLPLRAREIVE